MKISAIYIAKNEEHNIGYSLESLKGIVDELILVDTGSDDRTVEIFKSYGGKVYHLPWCDDFSKPRNFALSKATGDWIVLLDADEYFSVETAGNLRNLIEENSLVDGFFINIINIENLSQKKLDSFFALRAVRRQKGICYHGRIHEELLLDGSPLKNIIRISSSLLTIFHTGYTAELSEIKSKRNLKILQQELENGYPAERLYTYLVECYDGLGDIANMLKYAWLDVEQGRQMTTYASRSYRKLIKYYVKNGTVEERTALMKKAIADFPELPEFHAELGSCYGQAGYYSKAIEELETAIKLYINYDELEPCLLSDDNIKQIKKHISILKYKLNDIEKNFDKIYEYLSMGKFADADNIAILAYRNNIWSDTVSELMISIAIEAGNMELAKDRLSLIDNLPITSYRLFLRARVFFGVKDYWQALIYLEKAANDELMRCSSVQVKEKVYNLLGQCYRFYGYPDLAAECYYKAFEVLDDKYLKALEYSNYLFNLHYLDISTVDYFIAHNDYNLLFTEIKQFKHTHRKKSIGKIKLGYISPDFRKHVVLCFSMVMLISYNKEKFEVFCYSTNKEDKYSDFLKSKVTKWCNVSNKSYSSIAQVIYDDNIDILVDLCGHCSGSNLPVLAYKPAPIQISGIGYFATTGLKAVDYFITDSNLSAKQEFFTEKLLVLPQSHFCYTPIDNVPKVQNASCLKNGYITFGSFNNLTKVTDEVLKVWREIMKRVLDSRLLLKGDLFDNLEGKQLFIKRMKHLQFDLSRVELRGSSDDYMLEYFDMDIALDTFPYPGGGTTCDALYMGVPVITLLDDSHGGNFGASILKNVGLEFACADNKQEYIQKAVDFACDKDLLNALHLGLRNMMIASPLMDIKMYMRGYEEALLEIYNDFK